MNIAIIGAGCNKDNEMYPEAFSISLVSFHKLIREVASALRGTSSELKIYNCMNCLENLRACPGP